MERTGEGYSDVNRYNPGFQFPSSQATHKNHPQNFFSFCDFSYNKFSNNGIKQTLKYRDF